MHAFTSQDGELIFDYFIGPEDGPLVAGDVRVEVTTMAKSQELKVSYTFHTTIPANHQANLKCRSQLALTHLVQEYVPCMACILLADSIRPIIGSIYTVSWFCRVSRHTSM